MPRKSTKKRAPKPKKPGLLRYGYWSYPDPAPRIRELLAKKPALLEEFEALLSGEEEMPLHSLFEDWAKKPDVPAKVRALVAQAAPGGDAELFDEVVVASGSGPDVGSMISFTPVLYARRNDGMIEYRTNEDIEAPDSTEAPLPLSEVCLLFLGDPGYGPEELAEDALSAYLREAPTPESVASAVEAWGASAHFWSEFYDLKGEWAATVAMTREAALEQLDDEEQD